MACAHIRDGFLLYQPIKELDKIAAEKSVSFTGRPDPHQRYRTSRRRSAIRIRALRDETLTMHRVDRGASDDGRRDAAGKSRRPTEDSAMTRCWLSLKPVHGARESSSIRLCPKPPGDPLTPRSR